MNPEMSKSKFNCTICCQNFDRSVNDQDGNISTIISQTIYKIFGIKDNFEAMDLDCCPNCFSLIVNIHKILEKLDEAKCQLDEIIIKNATAGAGNYNWDQNSAVIARNEIIKRIKPCSINPIAVNIKLEDNEDLNEVLDDVSNDPDWNLSDEDSYVEKSDEKSQKIRLEQSNSDHFEAENLQFNLKTPVLKIAKLPQSLVNQLSQKNIDLQVIQNEIDLHIKRDQKNQISTKEGEKVKSKRKFACTKCDKSYKLNKVLKEHYALKHGSGSINKPTCPVKSCNKILVSKQSLKSHIEIKHPNMDWSKISHNYNAKRDFKCKLCIRKFYTEETMNEHLDRQHPACTFCKRRFSSPVYLDAHIKKIHTKEFHDICHICGRGFANKYSLKYHLISHEQIPKPKKFTCDKCHEEFLDSDTLWFHKIKHSDSEQETPDNENEMVKKKTENNGKEKESWFCEVCGSCLSTSFSYKYHMRRYHGIGAKSKFTCQLCSVEFYSKSDLKKHNARLSHKRKVNEDQEQQGHFTKEFTCTFENCSKQFNDKSSLRTHIFAVHQEGFPCQFCNKNLSNKSALKNHIKDRHKSDEELKYPCSICGRRFFDEGRLNVHLKWHDKKVKLADQRFKCDVCSKEISNQHNLKIHLRIHTGEKPFSCQYCDRRFHVKQLMINHEACHSNEKKFQCTVCNKSFKLIRYLSRHKLSSPGCRLKKE